MAEFQKVMEGPGQLQAPIPMQTNTGSLATDLTAAAGFGLQLLDRLNQKKSQNKQAEAQAQAQQALARGEAMAKRNATTLLQLEGTQLSLKRRQFETEALNRLSGIELEGYMAGAEKFGMGSYLKDTIDSRRKEVDAEIKYRQQMVQNGSEVVMSMASGADPQAEKLYGELLNTNLTEDDLFMIAQSEAGIKATAARVSATSAAEQARLGLEKTQAEIAVNEKVNEFMLNKTNRLSIAGNLLTSAMGSGNQSNIIAAGNEYKRQVAGAKTEFDAMLRTLPPESTKYLDLQKQIKTFNDATNQMNTVIDNADPVKANERMVSLALQGTLSGWLVQGTEFQKETAMSLFMGVPVNSQSAQLAVRDQIKDSSANSNPFSEMANNLSAISSGALKTTDPKFSSTLSLLNSSMADLDKKVPALANISIQGAYEKLPSPSDLRYVLKMRNEVAQDPKLIQDFKQYIQDQGESAFDVMRLENAKIIKDRIAPDLKRFGFEQGSVRFFVENGRVKHEFNTRLPDSSVTDPTTGIVTSIPQRGQTESRRRLNEAARVIEDLAKTATAIGEAPLEDNMIMMVETLNDNFLETGASNAKK